MNKKITEKEIKVFEEIHIDENNKIVYRIVSWNNAKPKFEIRKKFLAEGGTWRNGKLSGIGQHELNFVMEHFEEIEKYLSIAYEGTKSKE